MEVDLNDELDQLATVVRAGVSLDDLAGRVLGYSVQAQDADPARITAILTRRVPDSAKAWQQEHGVDRADGPVHVPGDPDREMVGRLCVPVRHHGRTLALLWVLETERVLNADEVAAADRTAGRLAEHLARAAPREARRRASPSELFRRLSRGDDPGEDEPVSLAPARSLLVTVALPTRPAPGGPGGWSASEVSDIERSLATLLRVNRACAAAYAERDHAALLHLDGPTGTLAELRQRLTAGPGRELVTGSGTSDDLRSALDRARAAARWAALDPALPRDVSWERLGLHQLASSVPAGVGHDTLAPLLAHEVSGPMLLHTVETYLDLAADAQRTAKALHLHRTTLYYRLNRAQDLLGLELGDGMVRTQLHVALKRRRLTTEVEVVEGEDRGSRR